MSMVAVVLGSRSDINKIQGLFDVLNHFGIDHEKKILSAHRTPDELCEFAKNAVANNVKIIIAVAGGAAHLPGVIASHTELPVIGVPISNPPHNGMDAILSMLEMPKGVPVVSVGAGSGGASNAALFAVRILSLEDKALEKKYSDYVEEMRSKVLKS